MDDDRDREALELALLYQGYLLISTSGRRVPRRQAYCISSLTGAMFVREHLLHNRRCQDALGMTPFGFKSLAYVLQEKGLLSPSRYVSAEEILAIGLHIFRHAAGQRQAGITFNRSQETVTK